MFWAAGHAGFVEDGKRGDEKGFFDAQLVFRLLM